MNKGCSVLGQRVEPIIQVRHLTKYYGKSLGIEDINLEIHKGEIFGFLGPNGAGKSTTIRLMLNLLRPSLGSVKIFNKNVQKHYDETVYTRCSILEIFKKPGLVKETLGKSGYLP